jgi:hypothetical protein
MSAQVIRGSKQEIAERIMQMPDEVREVFVISNEPIRPGEDIFAEMKPYEVNVGNAND